jgi:RimJ/RimL family protein N-acetyltransferase
LTGGFADGDNRRMPQHPWPLFDLRIRTPRLELRSPTDDDLLALLDVARSGVHDPGQMPFVVPWTDLEPPEFERSFLRYYWGSRASWRPEAWSLPLVVTRDGVVLGAQEISANGFTAVRTVQTGSWLGAEHQRNGIGTEMRAAVLYLAFEGLEALAAESGAIEGNSASARISEKLGYRPNGQTLVAPRGTPIVEHRFRLQRDEWRRDFMRVEIEGLEPCIAMFGAA